MERIVVNEAFGNFHTAGFTTFVGNSIRYWVHYDYSTFGTEIVEGKEIQRMWARIDSLRTINMIVEYSASGKVTWSRVDIARPTTYGFLKQPQAARIVAQKTIESLSESFVRLQTP